MRIVCAGPEPSVNILAVQYINQDIPLLTLSPELTAEIGASVPGTITVPPGPRGSGGSLLVRGASLLPDERTMELERGRDGAGIAATGAGIGGVEGAGGGLFTDFFLEKNPNLSFAGLPTLGTVGPWMAASSVASNRSRSFLFCSASFSSTVCATGFEPSLFCAVCAWFTGAGSATLLGAAWFI